MNITFCGAAKEVTGSNHLVEAAGKKFLVDCGLIQGRVAEEERNAEPFIYNPKEIDFMLLTHAHIDHSGRIPKLIKEGFKGAIYATKPTCELSRIMLADSGHIQEAETEWKNRKRKREGKTLLEPLYTSKEGEESLKHFIPVSYMDIIEIDENIRVRFNDAGHMLGSAIIEVWITENGKTTKIVFSGDLGNNDIKLLQPPSPITTADYVVMESTYGDRLHMKYKGDEKAEKFLDIVSTTLRRGGNVVIPSFAVGRTQEILYELNAIKERKNEPEINAKYKELMNATVYVDSPLAITATEIFKRNLELFDDEAQERIKRGDNPLEFDGLKFTKTVEESVALNENTKPCIIMSASGMCDAGRIKHHLKHNLWNPLNTILFVGYQAPNTLGRRIVEGEKVVKIFGEEIAVNAQIEYIEGYSGHADQEWLMNFIYSFRDKPKKVFLVHGEERAQKVLKEKIEKDIEVSTIIPEFGDTYRIDEVVRKISELTPKDIERLRNRDLEFVDKVAKFNDDISILSSDVEDNILNEGKEALVNSDITTGVDIEKLANILDRIKVFEAEIKNIIEISKNQKELQTQEKNKVENIKEDKSE
ncbi:MAG: MBL fold metallo-hydrolase [Clostridiales bacterium]|nr:MBL fold metallo-hydrolase [Clostridiales bacterium]